MSEEQRPREAKEFIEREVEHLVAVLDRKDDFVSSTLRFHLVVESQLDRLIAALLPRGQRLLKKGNLTFRRKLDLVEAFAAQEETLFACLSNLNAVRNECAHDHDKMVNEKDFDRIGSPLGKQYSTLKAKHGDKLDELSAVVYAEIFGRLCLWVYRAEHRHSS